MKTECKRLLRKIRPYMRTDSRTYHWVNILFFGVCYDLAYKQLPLYWGAQNIYYLPGFAAEGHGLLQDDWQAQQRDPFPAFTLLVRFTLRFLHPYAFHLYHIALVTVFVLAVTKIARTLFHISPRSTPVAYAAFAAVVVALNSVRLSVLTGGITWSLHVSIADYVFPGHFLIPDVFWAFVFLSVALFLENKTRASLVSLGFALLMHPTFAPHAVAIVAAYLWLLRRDGMKSKDLVRTAGFAMLVCAPNVLYTMATLTNATSQSAMERAQWIIVLERIPHHTLITEWGHSVPEKVLLISLALFCVRKTRLFAIMLFPALWATLLSVYAITFQKPGVLIMTPWRVTAFLAPLSIAVITAAAVATVRTRWAAQSVLSKRFHKTAPRIVAVSALWLTLWCGWFGARQMLKYFEPNYSSVVNSRLREAMAFVKNDKERGDLYLINPHRGNNKELLKFRLETGVPILVDKKAHPFEDVMILEWKERIDLAEAFYAASKENRCGILRRITEQYGITHFMDHRTGTRCDGFKEIFRNEGFRIYERIDSAATEAEPTAG